MTCEELHRTGERPVVWSLDERKRLSARRLTGVTSAGGQETLTVRLASGRQLGAAADSEFMTLTGWTPLSELGIDDRLAVPRRVPEPAEAKRMADDELILLAHMIGDGSSRFSVDTRRLFVDLPGETKAAEVRAAIDRDEVDLKPAAPADLCVLERRHFDPDESFLASDPSAVSLVAMVVTSLTRDRLGGTNSSTARPLSRSLLGGRTFGPAWKP